MTGFMLHSLRRVEAFLSHQEDIVFVLDGDGPVAGVHDQDVGQHAGLRRHGHEFGPVGCGGILHFDFLGKSYDNCEIF